MTLDRVSGEPEQPVYPVPQEGSRLLAEVRQWLARHIGVVRDEDLDILTLWAAHTYYLEVTGTTPRLFLTSPVPASGKTTVLEHLHRLCLDPMQIASMATPALLVRALDRRPRTLLIDEADRTLNPKNEGVGEVLSVLNTGYKRGATAPKLIKDPDGNWIDKEFGTYAPVVMAGNAPDLPDDTASRAIPIYLAPSDDVEESDWELIEPEADALGERLAAWAEQSLEAARPRPPLPDAVRNRGKERWRPLKRVAAAAGGDWPELVDRLAVEDIEREQLEREEGIVQERPHIALLRHLAEVWPQGETFVESRVLLDRLVFEFPDVWGAESAFAKPLTHQRMGRMLSKNYGLQSDRPHTQQPRGYSRRKLDVLWSRMGIQPPPGEPAKAAEPAEPATEGIQKASSARVSGSPEGTGSAGYGECPEHGTEYERGGCFTCDAIHGDEWSKSA